MELRGQYKNGERGQSKTAEGVKIKWVFQTKLEVANAEWRRFRKQFPHGKQFSSYPSVKIGRFAVSAKYSKQGLGSNLMNLIKLRLLEDITLPAYRFLTVDAYLSAIPFYEKNGFKQLLPQDENKDTRLMYFDMLSIADK